MNAFRRLTGSALLAAIATSLLSGCGGQSEDTAGDASAAASPSIADPSTPSDAPPRTTTGATSPESPTSTPQEARMRIQIAIGNERFTATLDDSAANRDLVAQLPVTIEMRDHGSVEKTGRLPRSLSLEGQPSGADPDVGDLGYYAPGQDLVLYYGDQSYYEGIVVLGRLDDGAAELVSGLEGTVTATVTTTMEER